MLRKRGEEIPTSNAAAFILMFLLFFVIYIIIIPTQDKAELVGDESILGGEYGGGDYYADGDLRGYPDRQDSYRKGGHREILLSENPGAVFPYVDSAIVQPLGSVHLYIDPEETVLPLAQQLEVSKSFWSDKSKTVTFTLENTNVQSADLYFFVVEGEGELTITVNGATIFEGEVESSTIPIRIPALYLRKNNRITFSAESPGINFFASHTYRLKEVALKLQQQIAHAKEQRTFTLTKTEFPYLERLSLVYFTNCQRIQDRGTLSTSLNGRLIDRHAAVCEVGPLAQDLPLATARAGTNSLTFEVDQGNYILEQLVLEKELNVISFQHYTFTVNADRHADIKNGYSTAIITLHLDGNVRKVADILVNGVLFPMDTTDDVFEGDISRALVQGKNTFKIIPRNEFSIVNLEVAVEE